MSEIHFTAVPTAHIDVSQDVLLAAWELAWSSSLDTASVNVETALGQLDTECGTPGDQTLAQLLTEAQTQGFDEVVLNLVEWAVAACTPLFCSKKGPGCYPIAPKSRSSATST